MPFNVCDEEGRHLGFVSGLFRDSLLIALSDDRLGSASFDWPGIDKFVAERLKCTNLWGTLDLAQLEASLQTFWQEKMGGENLYGGEFDRVQVLRRILLKDHPQPGKFYSLPPKYIRGYILMKRADYQYMYDDCIVLRDESLDYCTTPEQLLATPPLFFKIVDYPTLERSEDSIPVGRFFQVYTVVKYATRLELASGNVKLSLGFTVPIHCSRGMTLQVYSTQGRIMAVVCNGVIYKFV